jgi:hypothetical protein
LKAGTGRLHWRELKVHWRIGNTEKRTLDGLLARIESARDIGAEFIAKGRWLQEGAEVEVYAISRKR